LPHYTVCLSQIRHQARDRWFRLPRPCHTIYAALPPSKLGSGSTHGTPKKESFTPNPQGPRSTCLKGASCYIRAQANCGGNTRLTSFTPRRIHGREVNAVSTGASGTVCNSHSGYLGIHVQSSRPVESTRVVNFRKKFPLCGHHGEFQTNFSLELSPTLHVFHIQFLGIRILQTPESRSQFQSFLRH
jgi:hypothetical protein